MQVVQCLFLRALRVCDKEYLEEEFAKIFICFERLGYPRFIICKALSIAKSIHFHPRNTPLFDVKNTIVVPFVPDIKPPHNFKLVYKYNNKIFLVVQWFPTFL